MTKEDVQKAVDIYVKHGGRMIMAARAAGIPHSTFQNRVQRAEAYGVKVPKIVQAVKQEVEAAAADSRELMKIHVLDRRVKELEAVNKRLTEQLVSEEKVKQFIHDCNVPAKPPVWKFPKSEGRNVGVPTLFCSDWHWDEVVFPNQINGVNAYNRAIAERRAKHLFEKCVDLLINHMASPAYPYINVDMGGDFFSGLIHEELAETNEAPIAVSILSLVDVFIAGFDYLLQNFKRVKANCVPGNHGRLHKKPRCKNRVFDSYEWLFFHFLARHYKDCPDIHFNISDGADLPYEIYNTRYLLTHGDQFKGGSGIAGALSPLMLGDARKRKRAMATNQPYDFMLMGHWHQLFKFRGLIVNGSLKGYDEYAFQNNFDFELPTQAMWITNPVWGITAQWPIYLEKPGTRFT